MTKRTGLIPDRQETCALFLDLCARDLAVAKRQRSYHVALAHKYGMSNVEIGRHLGVSEARVRAILSVVE